jgi:hypothetical protein
VQGRYGKGVVAWDLPGKVTLAAIASGKPNYVATIHLSKGAPKSTRLDAAGSRKRASTKGDLIVEVKPGESSAFGQCGVDGGELPRSAKGGGEERRKEERSEAEESRAC